MTPPDFVTVAATRLDGGLTIMRVVTTEYRGSTATWTVEPTPEYIESLIDKSTVPVASWRFVDNDFLADGDDRTFRDAWKDDGTPKPKVDMAKARVIHRDKLRDLRAPLLEELDTEYMRADEAGDNAKKKAVTAMKKVLRDITDHPAIDAAQTVEELKVAALDVLP